MYKFEAVVFLTDGFEDIEAIAVIDILRRGNVNVKTVSIGNSVLESKQAVKVSADLLYSDIAGSFQADMLCLPGGPGYTNYLKHKPLLEQLKKQCESGKYVAAICAAPVVLGSIGLLEGKKAVCFTGMEEGLKGAVYTDQKVVVDGNIITGKAAGAAIDFALKLLELLKGADVSESVRQDICY